MPRKRTEPGEKSLPQERVRAVAEFVAKYREATELEQQTLADGVGVSQFAISKMETEKGVGAPVLVKLADYSGVLIDRILGRVGVEIDIALDYLAVPHIERRDIRREALALTGPKPSSSREWVVWVQSRHAAGPTAGALERVDLRTELGGNRDAAATGRKRAR